MQKSKANQILYTNNQVYNKLYSSRESLVAELLIKVIGKSFHQSVAF